MAGPRARVFVAMQRYCAGWVCAYHNQDLIGFVNVAWDGARHAFLLDVTVAPDYQRRGIGTRLVREATAIARDRDADWLHVDYDQPLEAFYQACGFRPAPAGLIQLYNEDG